MIFKNFPTPPNYSGPPTITVPGRKDEAIKSALYMKILPAYSFQRKKKTGSDHASIKQSFLALKPLKWNEPSPYVSVRMSVYTSFHFIRTSFHFIRTSRLQICYEMFPKNNEGLLKFEYGNFPN